MRKTFLSILALGLLCLFPMAFAQQFPSLQDVEWISPPPPKGSLYIYEFWATWCPPCLRSIPHLNELHNKYSKQGVVIVGISNESVQKIKDFQKKTKMEYTVGTNLSRNLAKALAIRGIPHAFVVKEGKILWRGHPMQLKDDMIVKFLGSEAGKQPSEKPAPGKPDENAFPSLEHVKWIQPVSAKGDLHLVEFWATWCPPCLKSIPHLNELHKKYQGKGLVIMGISSEAADTILSFQRKTPMFYAVGSDQSGVLHEKLQIRGIPTAFLVLKGKIVWKGHPMTLKNDVIEKWLPSTP